MSSENCEKNLENNQNRKTIVFKDFTTFLIWSIVTIFNTIIDPTWRYAPANTTLIVIFTTKSRGITFYCKLVKQNMLSYMNRVLISNSKIICLISDIFNWQSKYLSRTTFQLFRFRDQRILSDAKTKITFKICLQKIL